EVPSRCARALALAIFRILLAPAPPRCVDPVPVRSPVRALFRKHFLPKIRILRVSLPLPLAVPRVLSFSIFRVFRIAFLALFSTAGEFSLFGIASLCRSFLGSLAAGRHGIAVPNISRSASTNVEPAGAPVRGARGAAAAGRCRVGSERWARADRMTRAGG